MTAAATWFFTGRHDSGGASRTPYGGANLGTHVGDLPGAVQANRAALAHRAGVPPGSLVFMHQVHGRAAAVVASVPAGPAPAVDTLVTTTRGLALVVLVADCVPLLLLDDEAGVAAAVHAGRRGVQLGVVAAAVDAMRDLGAASPRARLGPSICGCCYEVGADVQAEVVAVVPQTEAVTPAGRPALDLRAGVVAQLVAAGVHADQIDAVAACTAEDPDLFSYRRDGVTGRSAGMVVLRP